MRVFLDKKGDGFDRKTKIYDSYLNDYFEKLERADEKYSEATENVEYNDYKLYHKWPIRKLEYSYVIEQVMKRMTKLETNVKILDAGCGVSPIPFLWAAHGADVTAIDLSKQSIDLLKRINEDGFFNDKKDHLSFIEGDLCNLPFDDNSFDIIDSISVIEHISFPNYCLAFSEMYRVLKPNGLLVCTCDVKAQDEMKSGWVGAFSRKDIGDILEVFSDELIDDNENNDFCIDENAIREFWKSHYTCGIGYEESRDYGAVGFCIEKSAIKKPPYLFSEEVFFEKTREFTKVFESTLVELEAKEKEINNLYKIAEERRVELEKKEEYIQSKWWKIKFRSE